MRGLDADLRAIADALAQPGDGQHCLDRIVQAASQTVPGADFASLTVRRANGRLETVAATEAVVIEADELQYALLEGPCYDAVTKEPVTYASDLESSPRWPRFGPQAAEMGLLSQMALRLVDHQGGATGLNLYSRTRLAFDSDDVLPELFASHARVAMGYATQLQTLQGAISTRETIGKAIGIVMERYRMSSERAFDFLVRTSQNNNIKIRDLAATVVDMRPCSEDPGRLLAMGREKAEHHDG